MWWKVRKFIDFQKLSRLSYLDNEEGSGRQFWNETVLKHVCLCMCVCQEVWVPLFSPCFSGVSGAVYPPFVREAYDTCDCRYEVTWEGGGGTNNSCSIWANSSQTTLLSFLNTLTWFLKRSGSFSELQSTSLRYNSSWYVGGSLSLCFFLWMCCHIYLL